MITLDNIFANNSLMQNLNAKEKLLLLDLQEDILWYWDKTEFYRKQVNSDKPVLDGISESISKEQAKVLNIFWQEAMIEYVHKVSQKKKDKK